MALPDDPETRTDPEKVKFDHPNSLDSQEKLIRQRQAERETLRNRMIERRKADQERRFKTILDKGGEMAGLSLEQKKDRIVSILETAASGVPVQTGVLTAARQWLDFYRWHEEMTKGKAPQRVTVDQLQGILVVDDLDKLTGPDGKLRLPAKKGGVRVVDMEDEVPQG